MLVRHLLFQSFCILSYYSIILLFYSGLLFCPQRHAGNDGPFDSASQM